MNRITEYTTNLLTLSYKLGKKHLYNFWRQGFLVAVIALPLAFVSCGKTQMYFPELEEFYVESMELNTVSTDSIARFNAKVNNFVVLYPEAKDDPLFSAIQKNIKTVSLVFHITINSEWGEDINFNF